MRLIACLAALIVLSGCKTTNMSWLNDNRKKEVYSDKATCGIVIAKSGINPYQSWKNAARSVPHPKSFFNCWDGPYEEGQLLRRCRSQFGEKCYITLVVFFVPLKGHQLPQSRYCLWQHWIVYLTWKAPTYRTCVGLFLLRIQNLHRFDSIWIVLPVELHLPNLVLFCPILLW